MNVKGVRSTHDSTSEARPLRGVMLVRMGKKESRAALSANLQQRSHTHSDVEPISKVLDREVYVQYELHCEI